MLLDTTERLYLERQVTVARAVIAALSLAALVEGAGAPARRVAIVFLSTYFLLALGGVLAERYSGEVRFRIPLAVDLAVLAALIYLMPSVPAFWFLFPFAVYALATRGNGRGMWLLVGLATLGIVVRVGIADSFRWQSAWHWAAVGFGTLVSGL